MNNSNETAIGIDSQLQVSNLIYSLCVWLLLLTPVTVLDLLLLVAIATEKSLPKTVKIVLANLLIACLVAALGLTMISLAKIILILCNCSEHSDGACRVMFWLITGGGAARLSFMATYAVLIYIIVKFQVKGISSYRIWFAVVIVWIISMGYNAVIFSPEILEVAFVDGVTCTPHSSGFATYLYTGIYIVIFCIGGFTLTAVIPIVTLRFIKKNTITGDVSIHRAMAKFSLFLLIGNIINFLGQALPLIFTLASPKGEENYVAEKAINYLEGLIIDISLYPTPILMLIYFKPLRKQLFKILCCCGYMFGKRYQGSLTQSTIPSSDEQRKKI